MKSILVTGGNRGIGLQVCKDLAAKNHRVILTARDPESGLKAANSLNGNVLFHQLDTTDLQSIDRLVDFLQKEVGSLDVLINNAAIFDSKGIAEANIDEIRMVMETNFYGPMQLSQALIPQLKMGANARIINVSSGMGALEELDTGYAGYRLSKAGLNAQTILFSNELSDSGIQVNAVCPGWVRTDMGGDSAPRSVEKGAETIVWMALADKVPTGKFFRDKKIISW